MIKINIQYTNIFVSERMTLTVGNINSIHAEFEFSSHWDGLARLAVFRNGESTVAVSLSSECCAIPWEVLTESGDLFVSLRGTGESGELVLCTENALLGKVLPSDASDEIISAEEATPNVIDALLADVAELKSSGGASGKSAYEIAVDKGFVGTEQQWLASLKGADGQNGLNGSNGDDGYTPVRGVDYWTEADISEIRGYVEDAILGGEW